MTLHPEHSENAIQSVWKGLDRRVFPAGGVTAGIGKPDDPGLRALRLQQERGIVCIVARMLNAVEHLAAIGDDDRCGVALQRMAERIVCGGEEPAIAAGAANSRQGC